MGKRTSNKSAQWESLIFILRYLKDNYQNFAKINVDELLKESNVSNVANMAICIRNEFLEKSNGKPRTYRWKPGKEIPTKAGAYCDKLLKNYLGKFKSTTPKRKKIVRKTIKTSNSQKFVKAGMERIQTLCEKFVKIDIVETLKGSGVSQPVNVATILRRKFLNKGEKKGVYQWKPGKKIPANVDKWMEKQLAKYWQKRNQKAKPKAKKVVSDSLNKIKQSITKLDIIVDVLNNIKNCNAQTAEHIINTKHDLPSFVRAKILRVYNDQTITDANIEALAESIINKTHNIPTIQHEDPREKEIQLIVKGKILEQYQMDVQNLQNNTIERAKRFNIELTEASFK